MKDLRKYVISSDIRRALSGRGFIVSVTGMALVLALSGVNSIIEAARSVTPLPGGFHAQLIFDALASDGFTLAMPVLCALPYTAAFVDDIKSGYIKLHLHRSGVRPYIAGKLIACALSGGLALLFGILIAYGMAALCFTPMELALMEGEAAQPYFAQLLLKAATLLFSGAFWSLTGFTFASATQSRYMAYASPFILYYVLIILHERYFESLYVLYPRELGIKQRVRVVLQSALKTPAAMGAFRPLLALPEDAQTQTDAQIRHICLHELTHIKHGDIAVIALMGALRAVYWFNPLVWLCFGLVRRDMEAACDSRVLRHIGTDARQEYIGTVLHFAERKDERQLYAAMGMADGRMPMEQRIRSMFRQTRTGRAAKAVALCLAALMLAMSALTACQPTPETPVVVGKDQDAMLSAAAQTPSALQATLAEQVAAPEAYSANVSAADGKLTVTADAVPLYIPAVSGIPIVRVTAADFTQAQVDALLGAFFGDETLYEVNYGAETKDEIMQRILILKQWKESEEFSSEGDQQTLDEEIAKLEAAYQTAPETSGDTVTVSDGQLKLMEITDSGEHVAYYTGIRVTTNYEDYEQAATLSVDNNNDMTEAIWHVDTDEDGHVTGGGGWPLRRMAMLSYSNPGDAYHSNFGQSTPTRVYEDTVISDPEVLAKLRTTPAEAKALVEQTLAAAGIDNMAVVAMYLTDDENLGNIDGLISPAEHYAYELYLCRTVNGVPVSYIRGTSGGVSGMEDAMEEAIKNGESTDDPDYSAICEWAYETINVTVSDDGIISFDWTSPLDIGETLVQSAALMPFADIAAKFEQQMQIEWEALTNEAHFTSISFSVDRVVLEYQRVAEQNSIESGLLVPVWNFYGVCTAQNSDGEEHIGSFQSGDGLYQYPLMSVNAIDGSVINISQGY